jgi:Cupin-like domain
MAASGSFVADVTRVVRPSRKALYENYIDRAIPVVIAPDIAPQEKGGLLTPERLRRRFENKLITVKVAEDRTLRPNLTRREIHFNDYVAYVEGTPDGGDLQYAAQIPFDDTYEGVEANMVAPILPDAALIKGGSWLWFGPSGTIVPMHFDDAHNFLHQHYGSKHITLVSPSHFESLRPGAKDAPDRQISSIDLPSSEEQSDSSRGAPPYLNAVIDAGDVLFIPAFWWHRVEAVGVAITINYPWRPPLMSCLYPAFFRILSSRRVFDDPSTVARTVELNGGEVNIAVCRLLADLGYEFAAGALAGALVTNYCVRLGQLVAADQDKGDLSRDENAAAAARRILDGLMGFGLITGSQNEVLRDCVALGEETVVQDAPRRYPVERARAIRALICRLDSEFGDVIKA